MLKNYTTIGYHYIHDSILLKKQNSYNFADFRLPILIALFWKLLIIKREKEHVFK